MPGKVVLADQDLSDIVTGTAVTSSLALSGGSGLVETCLEDIFCKPYKGRWLDQGLGAPNDNRVTKTHLNL
jgi:hypothetical protein